MADDKKISELPEITSLADTDLLTAVRPGDPEGTRNKKITKANAITLQWDDNGIDLLPKLTRGISVEPIGSYEVGELGIDQEQTSGPTRLSSFDAYQTLTHGENGLWIKFDLFFNTTTVDPVRIKVYDGWGLGGTLLQSFAPSIYTAGWQAFVFASPPAVVIGGHATIQFQTAGSAAVNIGYATGNPYPGGALSTPTNSDAAFKTYVREVIADYNATGMYVLGDAMIGAANASATSTIKLFNSSPGQITQIELNEGATKIISYSNDPHETIDLDKKLWTIEAVKEFHGDKSWQNPIINQIDFTTAEPASPTSGDRYINTTSGTSSETAQTVTAEYIYEWNDTDWTETIPTEGFALWDETGNEYLHFNGTAWVPFNDSISILNLNSYVSVSQSGNDAFNGKNDDKPVQGLTAALSKASALSPSFINPIFVNVLDGNDWSYGSGGITIPSYVHFFMPGATYNGSDIKLNDYSDSFVARHSGSSLAYSKTSGSNFATVKVNHFYVGASEGVKCTSGLIDCVFKNVSIAAGNLVAQFSTGNINIDVPGQIKCTSTGPVAIHDSTGRVNMRLNDVTCNTYGFDINAGTGYNTIYANRVKANSYAFDVSNSGKYLSGIFCEVEETTKSDTSYMNHVITTYRRSGDTHDKHMWLRNIDGIVLDTPVIKAGYKQVFTNLGPTPVLLSRPILKNRTYKFIIEATDGRSNMFTIDVAYNSGAPELVSAFPGGGTAYSAPMGTVTYNNVGGIQDQYNISINGFTIGGSPAAYNLLITRSSGNASLSVSGASTGTSTLQIIPIAGI